MVSMALTYPLVTASTRAQALISTFNAQKETFLKIIREEGVAGLYAGIESAMFGIAVTQGVYYYWYEYVKAAFEQAQEVERSISTLESMTAGAIAGAATSLITNPIWVVNLRQTVKKSSLDASDVSKKTKPLTTLQTIMKIYKEEGITGFWKGIIPALILVINPIIQYTVFERLKDILQTRRGGAALSGFDFFLLGAVSKLCATSITYPYIVVKSRMQLKQSDDAKERYNNVMDGMRKIIKQEGVAGLYKGIEAKLVQSVLASAFTFAFKEELYNGAVSLLVLLKLREAAKA
ncbi:mitochondrial carrier [Rhizoclosmatium globosum]|uniref:Mitochondrial carrier n=1 Tax=Rhizoclosmatium globosum TaxID=329046 RepID=A0A1Y2BP23_9FUNG|nr:mitochondrial carrier [Rhizoclosmatium globosum]|eukprot:ORY36503.1 mitochondrial carrier [Rhizoclosmatium globosum]